LALAISDPMATAPMIPAAMAAPLPPRSCAIAGVLTTAAEARRVVAINTDAIFLLAMIGSCQRSPRSVAARFQYKTASAQIHQI
jgi:hypothetical protein